MMMRPLPPMTRAAVNVEISETPLMSLLTYTAKPLAGTVADTLPEPVRLSVTPRDEA